MEHLTENPSTGATNQVRGGVAGPQTSGGQTEKKTSDGGWRTTSDLVDVDSERTDGQGRGKSIDSVDENGMYLWQRRNKELKDRPFGSMALYKNGEECLEIWTSAYQRDSKKKQSEPGMNKLLEGIPSEFSDVADNWHEKKWLEKPAEWNFWYWINNC